MFTLCTVQLEKTQFQEKSRVVLHYFLPFSGETLQKLSEGNPSLSDLHTSSDGRTYAEKCTMMTPIGIR